MPNRGEEGRRGDRGPVCRAPARWGGSEEDEGWEDGGEGEEEAGVDGDAVAAAAARGISSASELLGTSVLRLHGKLSQSERTEVFEAYRRRAYMRFPIRANVGARGDDFAVFWDWCRR